MRRCLSSASLRGRRCRLIQIFACPSSKPLTFVQNLLAYQTSVWTSIRSSRERVALSAKRARKMMIGGGTPSSNRRMDRMFLLPQGHADGRRWSVSLTRFSAYCWLIPVRCAIELADILGVVWRHRTSGKSLREDLCLAGCCRLCCRGSLPRRSPCIPVGTPARAKL